MTRFTSAVLVAAVSLVGVASAASAGITIDPAEVTVTSGPGPAVFAYPVAIALSGSTAMTNFRSIDLKLMFTALPDNTLRTVPSGVAFSSPASDFSFTPNPPQGTYLRAGAGASSLGFGLTVSAGGPLGLDIPANAVTALFDINFELAPNTLPGVYTVTIVPNDSGVLSLGQADGELNYDAGDFAIAAGTITVVVPESSSLALLLPVAALTRYRRR